MKISASKLIANRRNALKSTGPRSVDGKLASSRNAQLHGLSNQVPELEVIDPRAEALMSEARTLGLWLHLGLPVAEDDKRRNRTLVISPEGTIAARYDKIHLFDAGSGKSVRLG